MNGMAIPVFIVVFFVYFIPTIIAMGAERKNSVAITALNIVLGWTLLGWVIALVWACCNDDVSEPKSAGEKSADKPKVKKEDSKEHLYDALARLADLRDRGALTEEEFQQEKGKVLEKST